MSRKAGSKNKSTIERELREAVELADKSPPEPSVEDKELAFSVPDAPEAPVESPESIAASRASSLAIDPSDLSLGPSECPELKLAGIGVDKPKPVVKIPLSVHVDKPRKQPESPSSRGRHWWLLRNR